MGVSVKKRSGGPGRDVYTRDLSSGLGPHFRGGSMWTASWNQRWKINGGRAERRAQLRYNRRLVHTVQCVTSNQTLHALVMLVTVLHNIWVATQLQLFLAQGTEG